MMQHKISRFSSLMMSVILLISVVTGCRAGKGDDEDVPDDVFVPEITSLSSLALIFPGIQNITLTENAIYFTSTSDIDSTSLFRTTQIIKVELDVSDIKNLSNYTILSNYSIPPPPFEAEGGGVYIYAMQIDNEGSLWVAERSTYATYDFPSNFDNSKVDESEIWEYRNVLEHSYTLRKLDNTGAEVFSVDTERIAANPGWDGITTFHVDDEGNIFIGSNMTLYVLDLNGNTQFTLITEEYIYPDSLIGLSDGRVALRRWGSQLSATMRVIDIYNKTWGNTIELPPGVSNIFHGNDEYLVAFNDSTNLLAIDRTTGEIIQILNWIASGIEPAGVDNVVFLPDDLFLLTITTHATDVAGQPSRHTELMIISKTPYDIAEGKTVITIASYIPDSLGPAVLEFNRINALYHVEIYEIERNRGGIDNLILELMTGSGPDIIQPTGLPFYQWTAQGYFADLYEFIDADTEFKRSDFLESVLRSFEINGKLYTISPAFYIDTVIGNPDVVGSNPGWNIDEFKAVIDANPQATKPFGEWYGGREFLWSILHTNITSFIDWESGNVYFDNDYFIGLLEFVYEFYAKLELVAFPGGMYESQLVRLISSGEQIIELAKFMTLREYLAYQQLFGGDFVFKGYPVETGSGNILGDLSAMAITSTSKNQQGAWEFIRMLLSEEWQSRQHTGTSSFGFPVNRNVFEQSLAEAMQEAEHPPWGWNGIILEIKPLTEDDADKIRAVVDSLTGISTYTDPLEFIIRESVEDFFDGMITSQDAARIIQNRASTYIAEQNR